MNGKCLPRFGLESRHTSKRPSTILASSNCASSRVCPSLQCPKGTPKVSRNIPPSAIGDFEDNVPSKMHTIESAPFAREFMYAYFGCNGCHRKCETHRERASFCKRMVSRSPCAVAKSWCQKHVHTILLVRKSPSFRWKHVSSIRTARMVTLPTGMWIARKSS